MISRVPQGLGRMLKAVLFGFNGIIVNDEAIHQRLVDDILLAENLRPESKDYMQAGLGRSDWACLVDLLMQRGRYNTDESIKRLVHKKAIAYLGWLDSIEKPPIYAGVEDLIFRARAAQYPMALVTSAQRVEVDAVLQQAGLSDVFTTMVTGDTLTAETSKPAPDSYLLAIDDLNQKLPDLRLEPQNCVAIEDAYSGIAAAKQAGVPVIGVAHTYPYHMIQRCATWAVDYLIEIDFDWIRQRYGDSIQQPR